MSVPRVAATLFPIPGSGLPAIFSTARPTSRISNAGARKSPQAPAEPFLPFCSLNPAATRAVRGPEGPSQAEEAAGGLPRPDRRSWKLTGQEAVGAARDLIGQRRKSAPGRGIPRVGKRVRAPRRPPCQQSCRPSDASGLPELRAGPSLAADSTLALSAIWILALFDCTTVKIVTPEKRRSPPLPQARPPWSRPR
jgi:hypothetical protein